MRQRHFFTMGKLLGLYGFLLMVLFLFKAGSDATHSWYSQMALDFLLAGFGACFLTLQVVEALDDALRHSHQAELEQLSNEFVQMLDAVFGGEEEQNAAAKQAAADRGNVARAAAKTATTPKTTKIPVTHIEDKPAQKPKPLATKAAPKTAKKKG